MSGMKITKHRSEGRISGNPHSNEHGPTSALESARDGLIASELLVKDRIRKARQKSRKDYHIKLREKNAKSGGRGKHSFVILPDTFEHIIEQIEQSTGYKKRAVIDVITMMYEEGLNFAEIKTDIGSDTVLHHLREAISALQLDLGNWKEPSLKTLTFSRSLLNDASKANVELTGRFHVV